MQVQRMESGNYEDELDALEHKSQSLGAAWVPDHAWSWNTCSEQPFPRVSCEELTSVSSVFTIHSCK